MTERSEFDSQMGQEFSVLPVLQTGSGAHQAFYPMGTGVKQPGREADHTSSWCQGQENVDLYIHSPIRIHGVLRN
jgi:hypothetical protein